MFDSDYELLKAQALAGYRRSARKATDVSEKTRMFQTACDSRLTLKFKKINSASPVEGINGAAPAPASSEENTDGETEANPEEEEEEEEEITNEAG
jgi:hypothetical protein